MNNKIVFNERYKNALDQTGNTEVPDISQADLDTITKSGSYSGVNCSNTPNNDKRFIKLIVTKHTNDWIVQEVLTADDEIYLRALQGGQWYDWQELHLDEDGTSVGPGITIEVIERPYNHPIATEQNNGYMSKDDKYKIDRIESKANLYIHPDSHPAYMITEEDNKQFVSSVEKITWNSKANSNHTHQDILNKIETIEGTINSVPDSIELMQNKITELQNKVTELENKINSHIEPVINK